MTVIPRAVVFMAMSLLVVNIAWFPVPAGGPESLRFKCTTLQISKEHVLKL